MVNVRAVGFTDSQLEVLNALLRSSYSVSADDRGSCPDVVIVREGASIPSWCEECGLPTVVASAGERLRDSVSGPRSVRIPFEGEALMRELDRASGTRSSVDEEGGEAAGMSMLGESEGIATVRRLVSLYARHSGAVLIRGESGTGKELVARGIHERSGRRDSPFEAVNCGALPEGILEAELFGTVRGAFTGATDRAGLFESARGGTIFLDEIGEMKGSGQAKFLRVLESGVFSRLGESRERHSNARIVSATNIDLKEAVREGKFRLDLLHRLGTLLVEIPPLRERSEDIPLLAYSFLGRDARLEILPDAMGMLLSHAWPGNVRELKHVIERAEVLAEGGDIGSAHILFL